MIIRHATMEDAKSIRQISLDCSISRNSNQNTGFVEFQTPSEDEYKLRIKDNLFFYVEEENGKILGFFANYTDIFLKKLKLNNDEIVKHILLKSTHFIYSEQIAIIENYRRNKVASSLYEKFFKDALAKNYKIILCAVSHYPIKNISSITLVEKLGFNEIEEINIYDGLVFGIYRKDI